MTQMGLDYMKYKEQQRHNLQDEGIRTTGNEIQKADVQTRQYLASFKPQELTIEQQKADAATSQAQSSSRQAGVAERKISLDEEYRERETKVKESQADSASRQADASGTQASAATSQATSAAINAETKQKEYALKELQQWFNNLPQLMRETYAGNHFAENDLDKMFTPFLSIMDRLIPNFSVRANFK